MAPRAPSILAKFAGLLFIALPLAYAHDDGMDMSMDGAMSLNAGHGMMSNLHFRPFGDTLWFLGWVPESAGAMVGACVGLFLLGVLERWVASVRAGAERAWRVRAQALMASRMRGVSVRDKLDDEKLKHVPSGGTDAGGGAGVREVLALRTVPPFIASHDIARGALKAVQAALGYALMLAVMTYQAAFIISIVVGLGVGETLFGRFIAAGAVTGIH